MAVPSSQPVSLPVDLFLNLRKITTLNTCAGLVTFTDRVVLLGSHDPQWNSGEVKDAESKPVPSNPDSVAVASTSEVGLGGGVSVGRVRNRIVLVGGGVSVMVAEGLAPMAVRVRV
jgi:hypothetical protein